MRLGAFLLAVLLACGPALAETIDVPVVLPLTGGAAFLGQGERTALQIAERTINAEGGIAGSPLRFVFSDDQSSPQVAVQHASRIRTANPPIILGSAIVAMCNAMAPVLKDGPVMYCFSPGIHPPPGSRVFTAFISTHDMARSLVRYYRGRGFTRLAMITSTDASGQDGRLGFEEAMKLPENAAMRIVAAAQFNTTDVSVAAQVQTMKAAEPQAVIAWTSGSPFGTVLKGIIQGGLDVPVATTDANMTLAQMQQYAAFLPQEALFMSTEWAPHGPELVLDPRVVAAQDRMRTAFAAAGVVPDVAVAHAWDPAMLLAETLRNLGASAGPEQVRAAFAKRADFAGINGIYDFTRMPQRGLDEADAVVTRWRPEAKEWRVVSHPGGTPL